MEILTIAECVKVFEESAITTWEHTADEASAAYVAALAALREKLERENPEPLTKEELYQLDDEAVWCVETDIPVANGFWGILSVEDEDEVEPGEERGFWCHNLVYYNEPLDYSSYGKEWIAYRYKPKEKGGGTHAQG